MLSSFPCSPVIREFSWKKTQIEILEKTYMPINMYQLFGCKLKVESNIKVVSS